MDATCAGCGETFAARSRKAKWCSDRCRKAKPSSPSDVAEPDADPGLVDSVRRELEEHEAVDTFAGQLALQLAKRLSSPEESGISSLSKELRTVMAAALEGRTPPAAEEPEDEVDQARRRRDEKARAAAG